MTNLVLQSFGRENEYNRAIFTVLSFYAYNSLPLEKTKVILFTDRPVYFKPFFHDLPVEYVLLTEDKIKNMRGEINFLHRMKIALIEEAFTMINGNMLYADSDTFFIQDPKHIMEVVSPSKSFMHLKEYEFESLRGMALPAGRTFLDFLTLIESNTFQLFSGKALKVTPQYASWNAGVMMFHPSHAALLSDVYYLTDQFYPSTKNHASEQYAFSILLQENTELSPCESVVYHYWYRIKKQIIDLFLFDKFDNKFKQNELPEKLQLVKDWTMKLPSYFENHVLTLKDNAIQEFNLNRYLSGFKWAIKAIYKEPLEDKEFLKDVMYHTKRKLTPNR